MKKRVLTAIVSIAALIPVLVFSHTWVFPLAMGLLALIAVYEITGCVGVRRKVTLSLTSYLFATAILVLLMSNFVDKNWEKFLPTLFGVGYLYIFLIFAFTMLSCGNIKFSQAAELVAVICYIIIGFVSLVLLRKSDRVIAGEYLYLLVFIGAWMTDTGAYFIGKFFGKRKLIPAVSPNKTVAGAFGGVLGCAIGYGVYGFVLDRCFDVSVNYLYLLLFAVLMAVVSQLGDLIASCIKRESGIKDFGVLFPGHGGVMDRFDSILAVSPFLYGVTLLLPEGVRIFG